MADYKITLLKGDGIGPEIVNQAVKFLIVPLKNSVLALHMTRHFSAVVLLTQQAFRSQMKQLQSVRRRTAYFSVL